MKRADNNNRKCQKDKKKNSKESGKRKKSLKEENFKDKKKIRESQKTKQKKENGIGSFFFKFFIFILLIIMLLAAVFYYKVTENGGGIKGALITLLGLSVDKVDNLDTINVLLLGISEDINRNLTDTIIVCSYNPQNQKASLISIPRDTFVGKNKTTAKGSDKINSLYSRSPEKMLDIVSEIIDMELEYYAVVKTSALIEIIDILGGIDFEVPIDMDYDDPTQDLHIHLEKGMQKIDGKKAEQLLRFRHNNDGSSYPSEYGDNDYGRMKTQRNFILETIKQTITLKNFSKADEIINSIFSNLETNIVLEDLIQYIPLAINFNFENIISYQLPGVSEKCNDLWFFIYNKSETEKIVKQLQVEVN